MCTNVLNLVSLGSKENALFLLYYCKLPGALLAGRVPSGGDFEDVNWPPTDAIELEPRLKVLRETSAQ